MGQEMPDWGMTDIRRLDPRLSQEGGSWTDQSLKLDDGRCPDDIVVLHSLH